LQLGKEHFYTVGHKKRAPKLFFNNFGNYKPISIRFTLY